MPPLLPREKVVLEDKRFLKPESRLIQQASAVERSTMVDGRSVDSAMQATEAGSSQGQNLKLPPRPESSSVKSRFLNLARKTSMSAFGSHPKYASSLSSDSIRTLNSEPTTRISEGHKAQSGHQLSESNHPVSSRTSSEESETTSEVPSNTVLNGRQAAPGPFTPEGILSDNTFTDPERCRDAVTAGKTNTSPGNNQALHLFEDLSSTGSSGDTFASERQAVSNWESVKTKVSTWIPKKIEVESLDSKDIIIAVMGFTGAGKSSFINMVVTAGEEDAEASVPVGHNLESCTGEITMVELRDPTSDSRIVLVDTPGFDNSHKSDTEILALVADWLETTYKKNVKLAGIIYMHKISDDCKTGTFLKIFDMFRKLCGKHALQNVVLVTTMWDEVEEEQGIQHEAELRRKYWKEMLDAGSKTFRYERTLESAWAIMQHFLDPYTLYGFQLHQAATALRRLPVLLQQELVDGNIPLPETQAGRTLFTKVEAMVVKQQQTLKKLQKAREQSKDEEFMKILRAEFESQREQLRKLQHEEEIMKVPLMGRLIRLLFSTWDSLLNQRRFE